MELQQHHCIQEYYSKAKTMAITITASLSTVSASSLPHGINPYEQSTVRHCCFCHQVTARRCDDARIEKEQHSSRYPQKRWHTKVRAKFCKRLAQYNMSCQSTSPRQRCFEILGCRCCHRFNGRRDMSPAGFLRVVHDDTPYKRCRRV